MSDINWDDRTLLIHGKGNKERLIPISIRCRKHLRDYVVHKGNICEYLFSSARQPYGKLSKGAISKILKDIGNRAGLPDITVHCFRRWFASDLNKKGVDPTIIQELLGHESFSTTQRNYLSKSTDKAKYIVDVLLRKILKSNTDISLFPLFKEDTFSPPSSLQISSLIFQHIRLDTFHFSTFRPK